ncbi:MAG: LamG domain-containing protein, partial [FCB group bacterium]|nr:LamG domain-containing protein [FCB group bacterium]
MRASCAGSASSIILDINQNQYLFIPDQDQSGLDLTSDFTFETWLKLISFPVGADYSIVTKSEGAPNKSYTIRLLENSGVHSVRILTTADGSTNNIADIADIDLLQNLELDTWYHLAVVYVALDGTGEVFLDGVSQGISAALSNSIADTAAEFQIGAWSSNGGHFDGYIDDFRVWARAKSQAEVLATKDQELSGSEPDLRGYWKLNSSPA